MICFGLMWLGIGTSGELLNMIINPRATKKMVGYVCTS